MWRHDISAHFIKILIISAIKNLGIQESSEKERESMETLKINETPRRTSRNFNINNIKLENIEIPEKIEEFKNIEIKTSKAIVETKIDEFTLNYGLGEVLENQVKKQSNKQIKLVIDEKEDESIEITFHLDNQNVSLLENIEIVAKPNSKATIIIKYLSDGNEKEYHNGIIRTIAEENANIDIVLVNLVNTSSSNFLSIENTLNKNSNIKYTIVDFGGKNSITNYYSNLLGDEANNKLSTIYLGGKDQVFDINYIAELRGKKSNIDIDVQGALKDNGKKNFKGTIDFKQGCKKSKGNESEYCMLLSDEAKAIALPMLLCTEHDVEGNHSTASGKVDKSELFYIMSRGLSYKEAIKLIVKARFNKIIDNIKNENIKKEILEKIDEILN